MTKSHKASVSQRFSRVLKTSTMRFWSPGDQLGSGPLDLSENLLIVQPPIRDKSRFCRGNRARLTRKARSISRFWLKKPAVT